ncbi:hypothetical protein GCK72_004195 [Caenorhabditis remanei]|uniref:F-box domain-containing protein n=1 Tax=Caenorhabditis remanei TaxID=31234 RepID=A0A6A5H932_CAERE|nr:hypothetical protein GCK72_004195 [Caenorhabditis remanei]KAF1764248.1 hypothetical protein GCK72_004195 [Caenorhabditis remanei]
MSPIPFLKFPYLIQLDVLKQLEFDEIFLMSLCSKKVKIMIQSVNLEAEKLVYGLVESMAQAFVGHHEGLRLLRDVANFQCFESIPRNEMSQMNVGGNTIECSFIKQLRNGKEAYTVGYHTSEEEIVLKSLHCHISSLFRNKPHIQLIAVSPRALIKSAVISNLNEASISIDEPQVLDTSQLEDFVNLHSNLDNVQLVHSFTGPPLTRESRFLKIKALTVHDAGQRTSELMANFDGQHLHLSKPIYTTNDWYQLLRRWKRKEAYGNLKTLVTNPPEQQTILNLDVTEFDIKVWDGQRRPRKYKLTLPRSMEVDCSYWLDMQQDGGGKWASVMLSQDLKFFVVWD